jgi:hypothetical protein
VTLLAVFALFDEQVFDVAFSEEEKPVERLQQLLLRAHMVVEEADRRYITNSGMLLQLKMLSRAMYHGYHALDTFKCNQLIKEGADEVTSTNFMFGRQTEKQQVINFLLQHNPLGPPVVLPVIGGHLVGKKTLVNE